MDNSKPRVVIAGLRGGSGKTTLSLGLVAAWRQRGGEVVPFKKGPDYIDAGWLALAAGQPCYNLDPYMMSGEQILDSFWQHVQKAEAAVIEGNRGLFDGMDAEGSCSTAELAKLLQAPVLLVVDGSMVTRTAAATVLGCQNLDPEVPIQGVVLNRVAGPRHQEMLRTTIERYCKVPVVGAIPKLKEDDFPERHMGLVTALEHPEARIRSDSGCRTLFGSGKGSCNSRAGSPADLGARLPQEEGKQSLSKANYRDYQGFCFPVLLS